MTGTLVKTLLLSLFFVLFCSQLHKCSPLNEEEEEILWWLDDQDQLYDQIMQNIYVNNEPMVRSLLDHILDVNYVDRNCPARFPFLTWACILNRVSIADYLIHKGADIDIRDMNGQTPLIMCTNDSKLEVFKLLLLKGANVDLKDNRGWPVLGCALIDGHIEILRAMLEALTDPNTIMPNGQTSLMLAVSGTYRDTPDRRFFRIATVLLQYNADTDIVDRDGNTALHIAIMRSDRDTVQLLLNYGASITIPNNAGYTAVTLVQQPQYYNPFKAQLLAEVTDSNYISPVESESDDFSNI